MATLTFSAGTNMNSQQAFNELLKTHHLTPQDPVAQVMWIGWKAATERAAKVCDAVEERYEQAEGRLWPEMRTDAKTGVGQCGYKIREGNE